MPRSYIEFLIVSIIGFLISLFILFPHFYAKASTPEGYFFTGNSYNFDPQDINVYFSVINWAQKNGWYFQNAYTTQAHKPVVLYPMYGLFGKLFPTYLASDIYNALVFTMIFFLTLVIFYLTKLLGFYFIQTIAVLVITIFGGGLAFYLYPKFLSADLFSPVTFASALQKPHEALALIFYLSSLTYFYLAISKNNTSFIWLSFISAIAFTIFYPYHLLSFYVIVFTFSIFIFLKEKRLQPIYYSLLLLIITLIPGIFYSSYLLEARTLEAVFDPGFKRLNLIQIASGYGVLTPILLYQLFWVKKNKVSLFLNIWFFSSLALSFLPLGFSKYFLRGLFFPAAILSIKTLSESKIGMVAKYLLVGFLITITASYGVHANFDRIAKIWIGEDRKIYLKNQEKQALDFLSQNTPSGSGVLAYYNLANYVPTYTQNRVYLGHTHQTPSSEEKVKNLLSFYSNEFSDSDAKDFLQKNNIDFIIFGPDEKAITQNSQVGGLKYSFLEKVYENSEVTIFALPNPH